MRIKLIVGQYPESYDGELMPNVLEAWDEFTLDSGGHAKYLDSLATYYQQVVDGTLVSVREMDIIVPDEYVENLFKVPTFKVSKF